MYPDTSINCGFKGAATSWLRKINTNNYSLSSYYTKTNEFTPWTLDTVNQAHKRRLLNASCTFSLRPVSFQFTFCIIFPVSVQLMSWVSTIPFVTYFSDQWKIKTTFFGETIHWILKKDNSILRKFLTSIKTFSSTQSSYLFSPLPVVPCTKLIISPFFTKRGGKSTFRLSLKSK